MAAGDQGVLRVSVFPSWTLDRVCRLPLLMRPAEQLLNAEKQVHWLPSLPVCRPRLIMQYCIGCFRPHYDVTLGSVQ